MDLDGFNRHRTTNLLIGSIALVLISVIRVFYSGIQDLILDVYDGNSLTAPRVHSFTRTYIRASSFLVFLLKLLTDLTWSDLSIASNSVKKLNQYDPTSFYYSVLSQGDQESSCDSNLTEVTDLDEYSLSEDCPASSHFSNEPASWVPLNDSTGPESDAGVLVDDSDHIQHSHPSPGVQLNSDESSRQRSVRFNNFVEVRTLSPFEAEEALLSRLSYQASEAMKVKAIKEANRLHFSSIFWLSCKLSIVWFTSNFFYSAVISRNVNVESEFSAFIYSSSMIFATITIALFVKRKVVVQITGQLIKTSYNTEADRITVYKLISVVLALLSLVTVLAVTSPPTPIVPSETANNSEGYAAPHSNFRILSSFLHPDFIQSLISAASHYIFIIVLRREVGDVERLDIPLFLGLLGLFQVTTLWPGFFYISNSHETSSQTLAAVAATASERVVSDLATLFFGDLIFMALLEFLWIWCCLTTSTLISSMALLLRIPLTIALQRICTSSAYAFLPISFWLSTICLFASYAILVYFTEKSVTRSSSPSSSNYCNNLLFSHSSDYTCLSRSEVRNSSNLVLDTSDDICDDDRVHILTQET